MLKEHKATVILTLDQSFDLGWKFCSNEHLERFHETHAVQTRYRPT